MKPVISGQVNLEKITIELNIVENNELQLRAINIYHLISNLI